MKKLILFFLIAGCFLPRPGYSQATINYTFGYDGSGNRISRNVIILKSASLAKDSLLKDALLTNDSLTYVSSEAKGNDVFEEMFEKKQITIYPNPTKGLITVQIPLNEEDNARIALYDLRGSLLLEYKNVSSITEVDLSDKPSGTYLMKIFIGNKPTTWKIIKQN